MPAGKGSTTKNVNLCQTLSSAPFTIRLKHQPIGKLSPMSPFRFLKRIEIAPTPVTSLSICHCPAVILANNLTNITAPFQCFFCQLQIGPVVLRCGVGEFPQESTRPTEWIHRHILAKSETEPKQSPQRISNVRPSLPPHPDCSIEAGFGFWSTRAMLQELGEPEVQTVIAGLFAYCFSEPDNVRDHRAGTIILQAEKLARKPGFACITLLSSVQNG